MGSNVVGLRRGLSATTITMVVIVNLGFLFLVVAFSGQYWLAGTLQDSSTSTTSEMHSGLWRTCVTTTNEAEDTKDSSCYPTEDYVEDAWSDGWVPGVQALMITALITGTFMDLASNAYVFMPKLDQCHAVVFVSTCLAFTTGAVSFCVFMIYAIRPSTDSQLHGAGHSWTFVFGVLASAFCLIGWIFLTIESMQVVGQIKTPDRSNALHNTAAPTSRNRVVPSATVPEPMGAVGGAPLDPVKELDTAALFFVSQKPPPYDYYDEKRVYEVETKVY